MKNYILSIVFVLIGLFGYSQADNNPFPEPHFNIVTTNGLQAEPGPYGDSVLNIVVNDSSILKVNDTLLVDWLKEEGLLSSINNTNWSGTDLTVANGGTGVSTLTGYVKGNGTSPFTASATIPNTDISGLGTMATETATNYVPFTGAAQAVNLNTQSLTAGAGSFTSGIFSDKVTITKALGAAGDEILAINMSASSGAGLFLQDYTGVGEGPRLIGKDRGLDATVRRGLTIRGEVRQNTADDAGLVFESGYNNAGVFTNLTTGYLARFENASGASFFDIDYNGNVSTNGGSLTAGAISGTTISSTGDWTQNSDGTNPYLFTNRSNSVLAVQSQTSANPSTMELYSKDGDGTDDIILSIFAKGIPSNINDRETFNFFYNSASARFQINSSAAGTGTVRPIHLYTGVNTSQLVLNTNGSITVGSFTGTAAAITGRTSGGVLTDVTIGSGLTLSAGTLSATGGETTSNDTNTANLSVISGSITLSSMDIDYVKQGSLVFVTGLINNSGQSGAVVLEVIPPTGFKPAASTVISGHGNRGGSTQEVFVTNVAATSTTYRIHLTTTSSPGVIYFSCFYITS